VLYRCLRRIELALGWMLGAILLSLRFRYRIIEDNLRQAYKNKTDAEIRELIFANYVHYGRLAFEILHLPFDSKRFAKANVRVNGFEHFEKAFKKGKGVFLLSAHTGYWEVMGVVASEYNVTLNVITKYLRIGFFNRIWIKSRERAGIRLINETFSAKEVLKAIKRGEAVGFVLDQFMGPPVGRRIQFFGRPAWTIASLAWFVQKTGAAVVPVVNYRTSDGHFDLYVSPEVEFQKIGTDEENIVHNTQRYSNIMEEFVKAKPEQWLWLHRRWKRVKEDDQIEGK
jgi:Kdo2-lipid IVA lauroyltransferase/acyltransferase